MPSVYLSRNRTPFLADNAQVRSQTLDLDSKSNIENGFTVKADAEQVRNRPLTLAFRGHFRNHALTIDSTRLAEDLNIPFERQEPHTTQTQGSS